MADIVKEMAVQFSAKNGISGPSKQAAESLKQLSAQIKQMQTQSRAMGGVDTLSSSMSKLNSILTGGLIGGGILTAGRSMARMVSDSIEFMDALDDTSRRIDMTAKQYQTLALAAEMGGSSIESITTAIDKMHKSIGESIYSGKENAGLTRLGMSAKEFIGLNAYESFVKLSKGVSTLGSANLETAALMGVLGKGAASNAGVLRELIPLLDKAGQYTRNLVTDEDINKAAELADRLAGIKVQLKNAMGSGVIDWWDRSTLQDEKSQFADFYRGLGNAAKESQPLDYWIDFWKKMKEAQASARNGQEAASAADAAAAENLARVAGMADRIRDAIQTPAEKMNEQIQQAKEALNAIDPSTGKSVLSQSEFDAYSKQLQEQFDKSDPATIERNRLLEEQRKAEEAYAKSRQDMGQRYLDANMTPNEKYAQEIMQLNALLNEGAISWTTYGRAVSAAGEQLNVASGAAARFSELEAFMQAGFESTRTPFEKYQIEMQKLNEAAAAGLGNPDLWNRIAWQAEQSLMDAMGNVATAMPQMMGGMGGYDMDMMAPPIGAYTQFFPGAGGGAPSTPGTAGMATASQIASVMAGGGASDTAKQQLSEAKRQTYLLERLAFSDGRGIIL